MIYEVKEDAAPNAKILFHQVEGQEYFYWNQKKFKKLSIGDFVFVVNGWGEFVLFTTVDAFDVPAKKDGKTTIVKDDVKGATFKLNEPYEDFVRLKVDLKIQVPKNWKWKSFGSSQTTYLYGPSINKALAANRLEDIRRLRNLSDDVAYNQLLDMSESAFTGESKQYDPKKQEVAELLKQEKYQDIINAEDFFFQKAVDVLNEFKAFSMPVEFYEELKKRIRDYEVQQKQVKEQFRFNEFIQQFNETSQERAFLTIFGKLVVYLDSKAANKNDINEYNDKRTLAAANVRMNDWLNNLLTYKIQNGYESNIGWSISNAIKYLENPETGSTVLSNKHRGFITTYLFNKPYEPAKNGAFATDLKEYFSDCEIDAVNPKNYTRVLSNLLYEPFFRNQWERDRADEAVLPESDYDMGKEVPIITASEWLKAIHLYMAYKGFTYSLTDLANFYLSLRTKPFVILAGISGTGKTQLPKLFAEAIGANFTLVPVRPDWTDNSDLIGYTNLNQQFEKKAFLNAILEAHQEPEQPHFIVLDEMNLARVEHYFSDFLSIIETREFDGSTIRTKAFLTKGDVGSKTLNADELINLTLPQNVFIIGTVNMDETTHPFSKKVLDRANAIEINDVDLDFPTSADEPQSTTQEGMLYLEAKYVIARELSDTHQKEITEKVLPLLKAINQALQEADLQFGYRVRDVISFYMTYAQDLTGILTFEQAFDYQIMQKILPRIQGSSIRIQELLITLGNLLLANRVDSPLSPNDAYTQTRIKIDTALNVTSYPKSLRKISFMLRRYKQDGFTSFWL